MGRKPNPKCVYCARNYSTEDEAIAKNPECYVANKRVCYSKRYRIRNQSKINAQRRDSNTQKKGIETIEPISPNAFWVEFIVYGIRDRTVHAIGLKIYQGNELKFKMLPQHTLGLSTADLKDYVRQIMNHLEAEYSIDRIGRYYWVNPKDCPVCSGSKF